MLAALIRGINVGKARRVAMADLRELLGELGYRDVRTLLNSGNAAFSDPSGAPPKVAAGRIEDGMLQRFGFGPRVGVLTAAEFDEVVSANPLVEIADNPTRLFAAFLLEPKDRRLLEPLLERDWNPERMALGARAAYLWCPGGLTECRLPEKVGRILRDGFTIRNWATVQKLHALVAGVR
jgi:uncharacterized protein (DUF1697 family)